MTLQDEILAGGFDLQNRDDGAIAAALSVGRVKTVDRLVGYGTVLEALGAESGAAFLDSLTTLAATSSPVKWALKLLDRGELNIGAEATRGQLDALVAGGAMPQAVADALKGLATVPDVITSQDVAKALEGI